MATTDNEPQMTNVEFEELIELENEHNAVDIEILRQSWKLSQPLFKRRRALIPRIPHFWSLVFDEAPPEIENQIQPSDARIFAEHLEHFDVERFELESEPRSIQLSFEFSENPYFADKKLEKKFYWRNSLNGWSGLVSEPVAIQWKAGQDLTNGLTDATVALWKKWQALGGEEKRKGFSIMEDDATYTTLKEKLEESDFSMHSFFTLFTHVSTYRYVTAEESKQADEKEAQERADKASGKVNDEEKEDDEVPIDDEDVMACPHADDFVQVLVEELYSSAIKYFTSAHEHDSDVDSEAEFEEDDDSAPDLVEEEQSGPPKKKQKKHKHGAGCC